MKKVLRYLSVAVFTFSFSLAVVFIIESLSPGEPCLAQSEQQVIPISLPAPELAVPNQTVEIVHEMVERATYQPYHIPRLKNTRLAFPGDALNDDKPTKGFESGWLALYKTRKGYELRKARVKVSLYHDEMVDRKGEKSGRRYTLANGSEPEFIIKGIPGIWAGKVSVGFNSIGNEDYEAEDGSIRKFQDDIDLNQKHESNLSLGNGYSLGISGTEQKGGILRERSVVTLSRNSIEQILYEEPIISERNSDSSKWDGEDFDNASIIWSGDIDNDGKLDLMLHFGLDYEGGYANRYVLYISSQAVKGELVAPVAAFEAYAVC